MRTRVRAASYGASSACHASHDARSAASAARGSPSASSTAPWARCAIAVSRGAPTSSAICVISSAASRARRRRPGGQHDLDQRSEQPRTGEDAGRLVDRAARVAAATSLALGQPQERDPRLGPPAKPAGAAVCRLRLSELASQPMELGRLVDRLAEGRIGLRLGESLARLPGLRRSVLPCAVELLELGAAQQALPAEVHELRLGLAPAVERRGPLLRPTQVEDRWQARDDRAVRDARNDRRHLAGGHSAMASSISPMPRSTSPSARSDSPRRGAPGRPDPGRRTGYRSSAARS